MVEAMELQKEFKKTEVGIIPSDWEVKKLGDLSNMKSGETITSKSISEFDTYPCYGGNGLRGYTYRFTHNGDFALIGRQGALCGNVQYVKGEFFASEHAVVVTPNAKTDIKWLYYILTDMNLNQYSESSAQPGLSVAKMLYLKIPLPPTKAEQTTIATVLNDTDAFIAQLEKLIAKKRNIRQGAMQELLTGKKRVDVIYEDWHEIELRCIVDQFIVPMRDKPKQFSGDIPWCRIEDFNGKYLYDSRSKQYVDENTISQMNLKVFPKETLIVSCSADLGRCAILKKPLVTNQTFIGLVVNVEKSSNEFLYYFMSFNSEKLNQLSSGTTISYLSREQFETLKVKVPKTKEEQTFIAKILSDMDAEIEALEKKLEKYKMIKQGMMQNLLTGKIRLV